MRRMHTLFFVFALGIATSVGMGVAVTPSLVVAQMDDVAREYKDSLAKEMTLNQIAEAQNLSSEIHAKINKN